MYPNFSSLADKEAKRRDLLRQIQKNVDLAKIQQEAYSNALWAADVAKNTINLDPIKATSSTQTDGSTSTDPNAISSGSSSGRSTASSSVFSLDTLNSANDISTPMSSSTQTRIMRTDRGIQTRPSMSDMATSMDEPLRSESDMMRDEDYLSNLTRYEDKIWDQRNDLNKQGNIISKQRNEIKALNQLQEKRDKPK